jgi:hypothetical protein
MEFRIDCTCGIPLKVSEASAGGAVRCTCGRMVPVPPLTELRVRAGLPPYHISPELLIEHLLRSGELPPDDHCLECGRPTDGLAFVVAECERAWVKGPGFFWYIIAGWVLGPLLAIALWWRRTEEPEYGKDKVYRLPLPVCPECRPNLRPREVREWMCRVGVYEQLLDKFPDASVSLTN